MRRCRGCVWGSIIRACTFIAECWGFASSEPRRSLGLPIVCELPGPLCLPAPQNHQNISSSRHVHSATAHTLHQHRSVQVDLACPHPTTHPPKMDELDASSLLAILSHLHDPADVLSTAAASKALCSVAKAQVLWQQMLERKFDLVLAVPPSSARAGSSSASQVAFVCSMYVWDASSA